MGLLKRLMGDTTPSHEDLEREAAAEISQSTGPAQGPEASRQQWEDNLAGRDASMEREGAS